MGQRSIGILYGCEAPHIPGEQDNPEATALLVEEWEGAWGVTYSTKGVRIRHEAEGSKVLLGVWIAISGSGKDGAERLLDVTVQMNGYFIGRIFPERMKKARELWNEFESWCGAKDIFFETPRLWLTPTETA